MRRERNADFDRGATHGIALAMLAAGLSELKIGSEHRLWSYTHQLYVDLWADGSKTYKIWVRPTSPASQSPDPASNPSEPSAPLPDSASS